MDKRGSSIFDNCDDDGDSIGNYFGDNDVVCVYEEGLYSLKSSLLRAVTDFRYLTTQHLAYTVFYPYTTPFRIAS